MAKVLNVTVFPVWNLCVSRTLRNQFHLGVLARPHLFRQQFVNAYFPMVFRHPIPAKVQKFHAG